MVLCLLWSVPRWKGTTVCSTLMCVSTDLNFCEGTVFAYGQTSSGKTYTMMGTEQSMGIIPRAVNEVFSYIAETSDQREFLLRVSYLEIYNEMIRDLLAPENNDLKIHEDKLVGSKQRSQLINVIRTHQQRGVYVNPLREEIVTSPEQVFEVISRGESNRHVSTTDYNEHSSRSHCMFQIVIESRERPSSAAVGPHGALASTGARSFRQAGSGVRVSCLVSYRSPFFRILRP